MVLSSACSVRPSTSSERAMFCLAAASEATSPNSRLTSTARSYSAIASASLPRSAYVMASRLTASA